MTPPDGILKPSIGVSACLVGEKVRYDGGHKLQPLLEQCIKPFARLQHVCPEVSAGLGVPRAPIHLRQNTNGVRAIISEGKNRGGDVSDGLTKVAVRFLNEHRKHPLCGFIFKSRSPSCGFGSTPIDSEMSKLANGVFANHISTHNPRLAMVEETWLLDEARHFRFLSACFLVFHCHYNGPIDPGLLSLLAVDTARTKDSAYVSALVNGLLSENNKAALNKRLCDYWSTCP